MDTTSELALSDGDYKEIRLLLKVRTGIDLSENKRALVYSRLYRRLRELGEASFADYLARVKSDAKEGDRFVSALTTNVTDFFREKHHFEALERLAPELMQGRDQLTVWSSACSTGEEPWSIAVTLAGLSPRIKWRVLATDIDSEVIEIAKLGVYPIERIRQVPQPQVGSSFMRDARGLQVKVRDELRANVSFATLNLLGPWPIRTLFDVIFCRNVLIYFDGPTRKALVERLASQLRPGGYLMLGHSEALLGAIPSLESTGKTVFRRLARESVSSSAGAANRAASAS